jgi:hypothetical protein
VIRAPRSVPGPAAEVGGQSVEEVDQIVTIPGREENVVALCAQAVGDEFDCHMSVVVARHVEWV